MLNILLDCILLNLNFFSGWGYTPRFLHLGSIISGIPVPNFLDPPLIWALYTVHVSILSNTVGYHQE